MQRNDSPMDITGMLATRRTDLAAQEQQDLAERGSLIKSPLRWALGLVVGSFLVVAGAGLVLAGCGEIPNASKSSKELGKSPKANGVVKSEFLRQPGRGGVSH